MFQTKRRVVGPNEGDVVVWIEEREHLNLKRERKGPRESGLSTA